MKGKESEQEAYRAFCRLLADYEGEAPKPQAMTVATVCDLFLDHSQKHNKPDAFQLMAVEPCPPVEAGPGRVVTAEFQFSQGEVFHLWVAGEPGPIKVTERHPFWSVDREDWVPAEELRLGERLQAVGGTAVVLGFEYAGVEPVYNVEVDGEHCYRVGVLGLLVHNASSVCDTLPSALMMKLGCMPAAGWPKCPDHRRTNDLATSLGSYSYPKAQAHHIFPVRYFGTDLGKWLCCCGINLNSPDNGLWLPSCHYRGRVASLHVGLDNSTVYTNNVINRLNAAKDCADARAILTAIKNELLAGQLSVNNAKPADHPCTKRP